MISCQIIDKVIIYYKAQKGATLVHGKYTRQKSKKKTLLDYCHRQACGDQ